VTTAVWHLGNRPAAARSKAEAHADPTIVRARLVVSLGTILVGRV
jgi:hypothetical protein